MHSKKRVGDGQDGDSETVLEAPGAATGHALTQSRCSLCGEPMPPGEEMFSYHGYSCQCPKAPINADHNALHLAEVQTDNLANRYEAALLHVYDTAETSEDWLTLRISKGKAGDQWMDICLLASARLRAGDPYWQAFATAFKHLEDNAANAGIDPAIGKPH